MILDIQIEQFPHRATDHDAVPVWECAYRVVGGEAIPVIVLVCSVCRAVIGRPSGVETPAKETP